MIKLTGIALHRCKGAHYAQVFNDGEYYKIGNRTLQVVGVHFIRDLEWICFEDLVTGERFDTKASVAQSALGAVEEVNAMEVLALVHRRYGAQPKTEDQGTPQDLS